MSEFQYYEWQTIGRTLSSADVAAVRKLSSHIDVSPSRAQVDYAWGDFKHDPITVLARYFDAFVYMANWGTLRLAFAFPTGTLDEEALQPYLGEDNTLLHRREERTILEFTHDDEEREVEVDFETDLGDLLPLYADLLAGDLRAPYLMWMLSAYLLGSGGLNAGIDDDLDDDLDDEPEEDPEEAAPIAARPLRADPGDAEALEPPVPPGLGSLTPALQTFAHFFAIPATWIEAAAAASPNAPAARKPDYAALVARLPRAEADDFLRRLAVGEPALTAQLQRRLRALAGSPVSSAPESRPRRTWGEIYALALAIEQAALERKRAAAAAARRKRLDALAARGDAVWAEIDALLIGTNTRKNTQVLELLLDLQTIADEQGRSEEFEERMAEFRVRYRTRQTLQAKLREHGLAPLGRGGRA